MKGHEVMTQWVMGAEGTREWLHRSQLATGGPWSEVNLVRRHRGGVPGGSQGAPGPSVEATNLEGRPSAGTGAWSDRMVFQSETARVSNPGFDRRKMLVKNGLVLGGREHRSQKSKRFKMMTQNFESGKCDALKSPQCATSPGEKDQLTLVVPSTYASLPQKTIPTSTINGSSSSKWHQPSPDPSSQRQATTSAAAYQ